MKIQSLILTTLILSTATPVYSQLDIKYSQAYFYEFTPNKCEMSFDSYNSTTNCMKGIISVSADDPSSVNLMLVSELGIWQLLLSNGNTVQPQIDSIIIRSLKDVNNSYTKPKFYFIRSNGDILKGICSSIKIEKKTSGNCEILLSDKRKIQMKFETSDLDLSNNVQ